MNDKLKKFHNKPTTPPANRHGHDTSNALVSVTKYDGAKKHIMRVSLHDRAVKQAGWQIKDTIRFDVTAMGDIVLSRDKSGRGLFKSQGTRNYIRFSLIPEFYDALPVGIGREVEIANGCIAFCLNDQD